MSVLFKNIAPKTLNILSSIFLFVEVFMQISIDTSRDSKEDILKAINLLHSIIGEGHVTVAQSRNVFDAPQASLPSQGSVFGSFFDNVQNNNPSVPVKKDVQPRVELY